MVETTCAAGFPCLDLSPALLQAPAESLDLGYEGSHYGPRANRLFADLIGRYLDEQGLAVTQETPGS